MLRIGRRSLLGALAGFLVVACVAAAGVVGIATPKAGAQTSTTLVQIRAAHHPGYDRLVFEFSGALPAQRTIGYVTQVIADPSGQVVSVDGRYYAVIHMFSATAWSGNRFLTPAVFTPDLPNLQQVVRSGDFEGVLSYAIGLYQRVPIKVFTLTSPSRVVLDIPVMSWPQLKTGSTGTDVLAAQHMLRARGYLIKADGIFGAQTKAAVVAFQKAKHLLVDGVIGRQTWTALESTVRYGSTGAMVRAAQLQLNDRGLHVAVDGHFGPLTRAAVLTLQSKNWLPADGIVGPMTWESLICHVATW